VKALLLISILIFTFVLPARASRSRRPARALRSLLLSMCAVELGYALFLRFVYGRLG
jgi:hypothetical protein